MALAMDTGKIVWVRQTLAGDAWTTACFGPDSAGRGELSGEGGPRPRLRQRHRAGDAPDGRRLVIAGQKSGELYAVNADSGEMVWKTRAGDGGILGGIEWGFATDGTSAFVSLSNAFEKKAGRGGRPARA